MSDIQFLHVPIDNEALKAVPVPAAAVLPVFGAPSVPNSRFEVLSIGVGATGVLVVDGTNTVLLDLVYHDASADSDTTLVTGAAGAAGDLKAAGGLVLNEVFTLWQGTQSMDPGDTIRAPLTITDPDTAGMGYYFVVAYRVKVWNGQ